MSSAICVAGSVNPPMFYTTYGFSESANKLSKKNSEITKHFVDTVTFGGPLVDLLERLLKARDEYLEDNWDGYQAKAVKEASFSNAANFAMSLSLTVPIPEVYVDPEGDVTFEWYKGKRSVFSVSIGSGNELSYAGLYGASKSYGVEYMLDGIPKKILDGIDRVFSE